MIDIKDEHGRCPIHCAAIFANVEAVKVLLKANSNPNQVKVQIVRIFTSRTLKEHWQGRWFRYDTSSLRCGKSEWRKSCGNFIEQERFSLFISWSWICLNIFDLRFVSSSGFFPPLWRKFTSKSASYALLNWQDHRGRTALHLAVKESNIEMAKLLLSRKCDVSIADNKNRSALHWAAQLGRFDFVEHLIEVKLF